MKQLSPIFKQGDAIIVSYLLEYACISHIGKCRANNQDNFVCMNIGLESNNRGTKETVCNQVFVKSPCVFGVFDGMGGEYNGEIAAYLASKRAITFDFSSERPIDNLLDFCKSANEDICRYTEENQIPFAGTTAAVLLFDKKRIHLCNIGDSKIYRYSENILVQLSEDHLGVAAFGLKPPLTQNLGIPESELIISPYTASMSYHTGDKYLICSDGLSDMVPTDTIANILKNASPFEAAEHLTIEALNHGGKDNITLIVIEIQCAKKPLSWFLGK